MAISAQDTKSENLVVTEKSEDTPSPNGNTTTQLEHAEATPLQDGNKKPRGVVLTHEIIELEDSDDEEDVVDDGEGYNPSDFLADYPDDTEELELLHSRISATAALNLPRFAASLKKLSLRQNFIATLEPAEFGVLTELEELDLYDNKVKNLGSSIEKLSKLQVLDLSFNLLRAVPDNLSSLSAIRSIYFVQNKILKIQNLDSLGSTLRLLELGGNRIRVIENLNSLANLEELWLGKNKISSLENLSALRKLRILSVQSNRITKLEGFEQLEQLEELYMSHNGIERLEGLDHNLKLKTVDLGNNKISRIEGVSHLKVLEEFWMNNNLVPNLNDLTSQLGSTSTLQTIYLEGNPCQRDDMSGYRRKILLALPQVVQVDASYVRTR